MARASSAMGTPVSKRRTALSLNSRVNFRPDNPMTQNLWLVLQDEETFPMPIPPPVANAKQGSPVSNRNSLWRCQCRQCNSMEIHGAGLFDRVSDAIRSHTAS